MSGLSVIPKEKLTPQQLGDAAERYGVEARALRAVIEAETGGRGGFLPDGRVRILFERHILWSRLEIRGIDPHPLAAAHPDLCGEHWDPHRYPYGTEPRQWNRVQTVIDYGRNHGAALSYEKSAWEACSWGLFQLLGLNYEAAGFADVLLLKAAMEQSEAAQLAAALRWMQHAGSLAALRAKDWKAFALRYNGPGQVANYSRKLQEAYLSQSEPRRGATR
jgi:hypothetical protein